MLNALSNGVPLTVRDQHSSHITTVQSSVLAMFWDSRPYHFRPLGRLKPLSLPPQGGNSCDIEAASDSSFEKLPVSDPVLIASLKRRPLHMSEFSKLSGFS